MINKIIMILVCSLFSTITLAGAADTSNPHGPQPGSGPGHRGIVDDGSKGGGAVNVKAGTDATKSNPDE